MSSESGVSGAEATDDSAVCDNLDNGATGGIDEVVSAGCVPDSLTSPSPSVDNLGINH